MTMQSSADNITKDFLKLSSLKKFASLKTVLERKISVLQAATELKDLQSPGNNLHRLTGDRKGQYAIRLNDQYRICFKWVRNKAQNIEIVDYH